MYFLLSQHVPSLVLPMHYFWSTNCLFCRVDHRCCCLKVSKFQNEFLKSSFLPKYQPKIVRISALHRRNELRNMLAQQKIHSSGRRFRLLQVLRLQIHHECMMLIAKFEPKFERISALQCGTVQGRNP